MTYGKIYEEVIGMKKQIRSYSLLFVQGVTSLFFSLGIFFFLPHQFSEAIAHYVTLAPVVRNYYCFTLLLTGFVGIYLIRTMMSTMKQHRAHMFLAILIAFCIIYGLLIFPLVELFYQTQSGLVHETVSVYRNALMHFTIYLYLHVNIAVFCGYCLLFKNPQKKHAALLSALLVFVSVVSGIVIYNKYYDPQEVHLTDQIEYRFVGVNGNGSVEIISNDLKIADMFPSFVKTLTYEVINNGKLSNGEQIAITVNYDKEAASNLNLEVVDAVETVEVSGLREYYVDYASIPPKITEEATTVAQQYVHTKLAEVLPGKETQVSTIATYYILDHDKTMDSPHELVVLYRIAYMHEGNSYYYYRACHVKNVHSDALKDLEILTPDLSSATYRSPLCEQGVSDMSETEAKAHLMAMLLNSYDEVEEVQP